MITIGTSQRDFRKAFNAFMRHSDEAQDLLQKLLVSAPEDRLTVSGILGHAYLQICDDWENHPQKFAPLPVCPSPVSEQEQPVEDDDDLLDSDFGNGTASGTATGYQNQDNVNNKARGDTTNIHSQPERKPRERDALSARELERTPTGIAY